MAGWSRCPPVCCCCRRVSGLDWRRTLARRATDLHVSQVLPGAVPPAVGADRIAAVAMRAAGLLAALAEAGKPADRAGAGLVVEVYPAAAFAYRDSRAVRTKGTAIAWRWASLSTNCRPRCRRSTGKGTTKHAEAQTMPGRCRLCPLGPSCLHGPYCWPATGDGRPSCN